MDNYYIKNREKRLKYQNEYNRKNNIKVRCSCGKELKLFNLTYHLSTKYHINPCFKPVETKESIKEKLTIYF